MNRKKTQTTNQQNKQFLPRFCYLAKTVNKFTLVEKGRAGFSPSCYYCGIQNTSVSLAHSALLHHLARHIKISNQGTLKHLRHEQLGIHTTLLQTSSRNCSIVLYTIL